MFIAHGKKRGLATVFMDDINFIKATGFNGLGSGSSLIGRAGKLLIYHPLGKEVTAIVNPYPQSTPP